MSPYQEALAFMREKPGTGAAAGLAKLILSLYHPLHAFGLGECTRSFDPTCDGIAQRMIVHYFAHGEDHELRDAGLAVYEAWPRLVDLSMAAQNAKETIWQQWDEAPCDREGASSYMN